MLKLSIKMNSKKTTYKLIFKILSIASLITLLAMLPFFHDIITDKEEGVKSWVPDLGIQQRLTYVNGEGKTKVMGYSSYRMFLYFLFEYTFTAVGWFGFFLMAKGRPWRVFLLTPAIISLYNLLILVFDYRETTFNEANTKIFIILVLNFLLMLRFFYRYYSTQNKV